MNKIKIKQNGMPVGPIGYGIIPNSMFNYKTERIKIKTFFGTIVTNPTVQSTN